MKRFYPQLFFAVITFVFFSQFFIKGLLPIPADTITGLYHPYRDFYSQQYPNGMPYDNALITDPVRQQYPWKELSVSLLKSWDLPLWNPYAFAGTPLLANFQSAVFYPLHILFVVLPFSSAWSFLIVLQPFLAGIFMFYYLRHVRLHTYASLLGGITFAFSGFSVAWMEWGTIVQTGLWLPLVLLAKEHLLQKRSWQWMSILVFAEVSMLFAGHLQAFFYAFLLSNAYLGIRLFQEWKKHKNANLRTIFPQLKTFVVTGLLAMGITAIQWIPTLRFILLSARELDQVHWQKEGWFLPWQHLVQFIAPDFFGNPATLNYWGVWNYGEFVGYIGIIPLIFAVYAILFRRDKKVLLGSLLLLLCLLFVFPTPLAKLPFILQIPFLSSSQPTRLLFVIDFILAFLTACGLDLFIRQQKRIYIPVGIILFVMGLLWLVVLQIIPGMSGIRSEDLATAKRNLYLPTLLLLSSFCLLITAYIKKPKYLVNGIVIVIILITIFDLFRFFYKFTSFSEKEYLYPMTKTIAFLQKQQKPFRVMSLDSRILPPNFSSMYRIETIEGYDPLYVRRYGEFVTALERGKPDISGPFGFNRIITPRNYNSPLIDLLNVRYVLSLDEVQSPKLKKVFEEGQTKVYENVDVMPRVFIAKNIRVATSDQEEISLLFDRYTDVKKTAILQVTQKPAYNPFPALQDRTGTAKIILYSENKIVVETNVTQRSLLVLSDVYYPTWKAVIDKDTSREEPEAVWKVNYTFRGVIVPEGRHTVEFYNSVF